MSKKTAVLTDPHLGQNGLDGGGQFSLLSYRVKDNRIDRLKAELDTFARQWRSVYLRVREWLTEQISLLQTTTAVRETGMCFIILGWLAAADRERLSARLEARFGGRVVVVDDAGDCPHAHIEDDRPRQPLDHGRPLAFFDSGQIKRPQTAGHKFRK